MYVKCVSRYVYYFVCVRVLHYNIFACVCVCVFVCVCVCVCVCELVCVFDIRMCEYGPVCMCICLCMGDGVEVILLYIICVYDCMVYTHIF